MGTKGIRLKMLLPLMVAISVLTEASTGSLVQVDPEINLPAIVFRKEHGTPVKFRGSTFQRNFCAAFPDADGAFLTSAHCLATAPRTKSIDLVGLGNVEIEGIRSHPKLDLAVFRLKDGNPVPGYRSVGLNSKVVDETCTVLVLNKAFRWTVLHSVTPSRCPDNTTKDKICFKSEKTPTGLDYAVVCAGGRTLRAVFHGQRGAELSFTVCSTEHCSEFVKLSSTTRVKRQDDAAAPKTDATVPPAATDVSPSSAPAVSTDTDDVPMPPPNQQFPDMPRNFPYPTLNVVQSPPVPTRPRSGVFGKLSATRVKRQDDSAAPAADDTAAAPAADDTAAAPAANDTATAPAADDTASSKDTAAAPAADDTAAAPAADDTAAAQAAKDTPAAPAASAAAPSDATGASTGPAAPPASTDGSPGTASAAGAVDSGDVPLPPPSQLFPNMPKNFPYPTLDVVQSPPVPTRPRKRPMFSNPYPVQAAKENPFPGLPGVNAMNPDQPAQPAQQQVKDQPSPVASNDADAQVQLPARTESPEVADLTEYEVLGTQDPPVLPANNDVKGKEARPATPQQVAENIAPYDDETAPQYIAGSNAEYTAPESVQQRVPRPSAGGFAMAPADWRYSVTPRPHRRCKTTASRQACRPGQPSAVQAVPYDEPAPPARPVKPKCRDGLQPNPAVETQPNQGMGAAAAGAAGILQPVGVDPWMVAAQKAVPASISKPKDEPENPAEEKPNGSAGRSGLSFVALVVANALYFML